jgi:hypothetical protein
MFPLDYLLAVALLTSPVDAPEPANAPDLFATLQPALQGLAVEWEILDPREVRYVLTRPEDFGSDLKLLRRRFHDLADAPPLTDGARFPDRNTISELLSFNRAYRQHLDNRLALDPTGWWEHREAILEADRLYQVWDTLRDARCDYYYITVRRQALKKLRQTIGDQAYYSGVMPPHVPVWRFQRID